MSTLSVGEHDLVQVDHRLIEALQEREHQLDQVERLAHTGSWEWDIAADAIDWSDELYRIFGLATGELEPTYPGALDRVHPDDRDALDRLVSRCMKTRCSWALRHRIIRPDGEVRHVEGRGEVVTDGDGVAVRMHGTLRDRTASVLLQRHFHEVSEAFELIRLTAGAVHDAPDVEAALCSMLELVCRFQKWRVGRVWRVGAGRLGDLIATELVSGLSGVPWPAPSLLASQALEHREPRARPPAGAGGPVVVAAPIEVRDEILYVVEFEGDHPLDEGHLLIAAIRSVCSIVAQRIERDLAARVRQDLDTGLATLFRYTDDAIAVLAADGTVRYASPAMERNFGYTEGSKIGTSIWQLVHGEDRQSARRHLEPGEAHSSQTGAVEMTVAHADGSSRHVEISQTDIADDPSVDGEFIVKIRDVTERWLAENRVMEAKSHDPLTGLSTRAVFLEQVQRALAFGRRNGWKTAIFSVDLDDFHRVNDEYGHVGGDEVLVVVADRLRTSLRQHDTVARGVSAITRVGGDEFLLMCESVRDEAAALVIAKRVLGAVALPIELDSGEVVLTAGIGISMSASDSDPQLMVFEAEAAQRHAKELGGARHQFFTAEHHERAAAQSALVEALHRAVAADELRLMYQPKISLATNRIVGVEALLRWEHPERGLVMPDEFIPAAEQSGIVVQIGAWVLKESLRQAAVWHQAYPRVPLQLAVNVSARQFRTELADTICVAIKEAGISASTVCLEMTETTIMDDIDCTVAILNELKELGLTVSVDDFGTGYSSLEYLHRMPINEVKIDRSFVAGLGSDAVNTAIVASVISLAHAMNLEVVAEGVETREQLERLRTLGCDFAQGYFIARPMPPAEIDDYLAADALGQELPRADPTGGVVRRALSETVLVVDDTPDVRMLARMSLTAVGYTVEEAGNGAAALALARRLDPQCVLLDVSMPDMSGIDVCRALRNDPATAACTIVMLTSHADSADKAEAFLVGADDYIVKPFAPRDLVARVRSAVRGRQTRIGAVGRQVDDALREMLRTVRERELGEGALSGVERLSSRQIEIVKRLLGGERVPAIARELFLSQSTVRNHLSVIYQRLGVHSQEELLILLREKRSGLSPPG